MDRNVTELMDLLVVPGASTKEEEINEYLIARLLDLGVPREAIQSDETHRQSEYGGAVGNLVVRLDGHGRGERIMLSTHMDTVPSVVGCKPKIDGDRIVNAASDRALGGDARCGCVCVLVAIRAVLDLRGGPQSPHLRLLRSGRAGPGGRPGDGHAAAGRPPAVDVLQL